MVTMVYILTKFCPYLGASAGPKTLNARDSWNFILMIGSLILSWLMTHATQFDHLEISKSLIIIKGGSSLLSDQFI